MGKKLSEMTLEVLQSTLSGRNLLSIFWWRCPCHLHLRYAGDNDELYFRDYLREHSEVAKGYEAMKLKLWKKYENDRDGYTNAKADFVKKYTKEAKAAKAVYGERY